MYYNPLFYQTADVQEAVFLSTDLGRLYQSIPFSELALHIQSPDFYRSGRGRKPFLRVEGGIALMILKHYLGLSDALLIERLNTDWSMQYFCGVRLGFRKIKDKNLVSWWRTYLAGQLDMDKLQAVLIKHWKPHMNQTHVTMIDATCVESHLRYPTSVKLLWESCRKVYELMQALRHRLKLRASRSNYSRHEGLFLNYQRSRKKTRRQEKRLRKQLLKYLLRLLQCFAELVDKHGCHIKSKHRKLIATINKVYEQQHELTYGNAQNVTGRIVSLHKPYIRPIVRGKETKAVEFGAKLHKLQVDGISFIEHMSYDNFNEGTRLKNSVAFHQKHFGKLSQLGADRIYATNENRRYLGRLTIANSFVAKGNQGKLAEQKQTMRSALSAVRATVLEGSFGNEKNHYLLNKIKARTQSTERAWIFFGMMTANASIISQRMDKAHKKRYA